jgi:hypothetical protein
VPLKRRELSAPKRAPHCGQGKRANAGYAYVKNESVKCGFLKRTHSPSSRRKAMNLSSLYMQPVSKIFHLTKRILLQIHFY